MSNYTLSDLAQMFLDELKNEDPRLENIPVGSVYDSFAGSVAAVTALAMQEDDLNYEKHFIQTAQKNDLDYLATDSYGSDFARPQPTNASGLITFYLNAETNNVNIPTGTIVKTQPNSLGQSIRFETIQPVSLSVSMPVVSVAINCTIEGSAGNVSANTLTVIESSLTSQLVTCNNLTAISNGEDSLDDGQYRTFIYNLLATYRKYTINAIESAAKTVSGVTFAQGVGIPMSVIQWSGTAPIGSAFQIERAYLFIGGSSGTLPNDTISAVQIAIKSVKALGVYVEVESVESVQLVWEVKADLIAGSTFYLQFASGDYSSVTDVMNQLILSLPTVTSENPVVTFDPVASLSYLLAQFPDSFLNAENIQPTASVVINTSGQKFIPAVKFNGYTPPI